MIRIPAEALRPGNAVPFRFPPSEHILPTFKSNFIDYDVVLDVTVDIPWASEPSFEAPPPRAARRLNAGRRLDHEHRGRREAAGDRRGDGAEHWSPGGARAHARTGGHRTRRRAYRRCTTRGEAGNRCGLHVSRRRGSASCSDRPASWRAFGSRRCCRRTAGGTSCAASQESHGRRSMRRRLWRSWRRSSRTSGRPRRSGYRITIWGSTSRFRMTSCHAWWRSRARHTRRRRPSLTRSQGFHSRCSSRWHGPRGKRRPPSRALCSFRQDRRCAGLSFRARVLGGEERVIGAAIRTVWTKEGPTIHVDVDLRGAPLPKEAWGEGVAETATERLHAGARLLFVGLPAGGWTGRDAGASGVDRTIQGRCSGGSSCSCGGCSSCGGSGGRRCPIGDDTTAAGRGSLRPAVACFPTCRPFRGGRLITLTGSPIDVGELVGGIGCGDPACRRRARSLSRAKETPDPPPPLVVVPDMRRIRQRGDVGRYF